jgi:hypothetical protein
MQIDWSAFSSALLGTTIPGLVVSALLLYLNNKSSKSVEAYKVELSSQLTELQQILAHDEARVRLWHERRVNALVDIYQAFVLYLKFLRRAHYVRTEPPQAVSLDPMWDFSEVIEKNRLYLDDELHDFVQGLSVELLKFWNFAVMSRVKGDDHTEIQRQLDDELPKVLNRLRVRIHEYADPAYVRRGEA